MFDQRFYEETQTQFSPQVLSKMWFKRCFLGTRTPSTLVPVAVQHLWISWTSNLGSWHVSCEATRRMENKVEP